MEVFDIKTGPSNKLHGDQPWMASRDDGDA